MNNKSKIGLGLVTYKAEHRILQSAITVPEWIENFVIVNDGTPYTPESYPKQAHIIQHEVNECVGKSKSDAMNYLIAKGCEHIFIMEDDVLIKDDSVFERYIKTSEVSGIKHLSYALQGPANRKDSKGFSTLEERAATDNLNEPNPKTVLYYENDIKVALYPNSVGAFCYYHKDVIDKVGVFDPIFKNAWEHVEHSYQCYKNGFCPEFWWFPDIWESWLYLEDIENCITESTISHTPEWHLNYNIGAEHYKKKHGHYPTGAPQVDIDIVVRTLNKIKKEHAK